MSTPQPDELGTFLIPVLLKRKLKSEKVSDLTNFTQPGGNWDLDVQEMKSSQNPAVLFGNWASFNKSFDHFEPQLLIYEVVVTSLI